MKVYLINPPAVNGVKIVREGRCMQRKGAWTAVWSPLSLALMAAVLERAGWQAKLSDCIVEEIDFESLRRSVAEFKPDLAVINAVTPSIESDLTTCRIIKEVSPDTVTVAIGIHPAALPEECLRSEPCLDFVVRGEPEAAVSELAAAMAHTRGKQAGTGIQGLSYIVDGKLVQEPERPAIQNLDSLPFPAWHLVDRSKYIMPFTDRPFLLIATSRGCPFKCNFCADATFYGKKLRTRSAKSVVDEIEWVKNTFGIDEFLFWSESFTINRTFAVGVAQEILRRKIKISWVCNSRVDNVDPEMLGLFKSAGCWMVGFGIESGNQSILDRMEKGITIEQITTAVQATKAAGLEVTGHCVLGYPGETVRTMKDTIALTKRLPFDFVQFYCSVPFPGSSLYARARDNGWLTTRDWTKYEQNFSVMNTPELMADDVMRWRGKAYKAFYLRPSTVIKTLRRLSSWKELKNFIGMARDFLTWV